VKRWSVDKVVAGMRILTALMSTIFGLLLLLATVVSWMILFEGMCKLALDVRELEVSKPLAMMLAILLLALPSWVLFRILDRIYRHVHPAAYESSLPVVSDPGPSFTMIQAVICSLRSSALCVAVPNVSFGLSLMPFVLLLLVTGDAGHASGNRLWLVAAAELLMIGLLGWLVQWSYSRGVLRLMQQKSAATSDDPGYERQAHAQAGKLRFRVRNAAEPIRTSKRGAEMQRSARRLRRLAWLHDAGAPLAAMAGILAVAWFFPTGQLESLRKSWIIGIVVTWAILFVIARAAAALCLADHTPLRQLRLGVGLWLHAFLVACVAPWVLLFELPGRSGRSAKQWTIVPKLGQWVSGLLRSPRLFWMPATLFAPAVVLVGLSGDVVDETMALWSLACFGAGAVAFEITYRMFERLVRPREDRSNSLVFLRVFGDRRRGRFLFAHVAPRWRGLGSITCIAAPDVSVHQLEPDVGLDILFGRLRQRFLAGDAAHFVGRHLGSDALGPVFEDHCFDDTWKAAMQSMLSQNAIVLMDLRGFGLHRKGCIYELGVLRDNMPMGAVVFLIDGTTDFKFLKSTLEQLWNTMGSHSPNASDVGFGSADQRQITIFRMSASERTSARQLVALLTEACVSGEAYNQARGRVALKGLVDDLQLLAADAPAQVEAVGGGGWPGKKVLEAGYSCDPDFNTPDELSYWGLITDQQHTAILDVHESVQEIRCGGSKQTAAAMNDDPAWQELRVAARSCLEALGKQRSSPKPRTG
jgi:hypothetical protein